MLPALATSTATYRLQLHGGLDFAGAIAWLPHLADLGISDIIRPEEFDPALGGREGRALAAAAKAQAIALIIDIVPHRPFRGTTPVPVG